jgi:hypothetical protein
MRWNEVRASHVGTAGCVYGKVYNYGPYSNHWTFIRFSASTSAIQMQDFNYYYYSPLNIGDCVVVYGRIRDNGSYLIITPDKDANDSVQVLAPSSLCE